MTPSLMYRKIYKAGIFVYAVLFILSLVFYKERIILLDDAFYLFDHAIYLPADSFITLPVPVRYLCVN